MRWDENELKRNKISTNVTAAPGTGIKQPTTTAKTGMTRCGKKS
jgi:hypothetical protein